MVTQLEDQSVSRIFRLVARGNEDAVDRLWGAFFQRLLEYTRIRNRKLRSGIADEEDIALSTFNSVCVGLREGQFPDLTDRDSLWRLMVTIASRKSADRFAYETRHKRNVNRTVRVDSVSVGNRDSQLGITPQMEVEFQDLLDHLLGKLVHEDLRQIVLLKLEGHKNAEIAIKMQRSLATIERKLKTIREIWKCVA